MNEAAALVIALLEAGDDARDFLTGAYFAGNKIVDNDEVQLVEPHTYEMLITLTGSEPPYDEREYETARQEGRHLFVLTNKATGDWILYDVGKGPVKVRDADRRRSEDRLEPLKPYLPQLHDHAARQIAKKVDPLGYLHVLLRLGGEGVAVQRLGRWISRVQEELSPAERLRLAVAYRRQGRRAPGYLRGLVQTDQDTKFVQDGVLLLYDDWGDLADMFSSKADRERAAQVLSGDMDFWEPDSQLSAKEGMGSVTDELSVDIRNKLIGYGIDGPHVEEYEGYFPDGVITVEGLAEMTDREVGELIDANDSNLVDFQRAFRWAADDAIRSAHEAEAYEAVTSKITDAMGEYKWIKHQGKSKLAFKFSFDKLAELMTEYADNNYDSQWEGSMRDLVNEMVQFSEPNYDRQPDWNEEYFNEQLAYHIGEIDEQDPTPEEKVDPNQLELKLGEIERTDRSKEQERVFLVFGDDHPRGVQVRMRIRDYEEFAKAYPHRVDRHKWAAYWQRKKEAEKEAEREQPAQAAA